jgi:hypothetical protein
MMAVQSVRFIGAIQRSRQADVDLKTTFVSGIKPRNTVPSPAHSKVVSLLPMKPRRDDRALCMLSAAPPAVLNYIKVEAPRLQPPDAAPADEHD